MLESVNVPADFEVVVEAALPLSVGEDSLPPVAVAVEPELEVVPDDFPVRDGLGADAVDDVDDEDTKLAGSVRFEHERSYNGVVLSVKSLLLLPTRPKLGSGAVGAASCRTYHHVFTLPNADKHPT